MRKLTYVTDGSGRPITMQQFATDYFDLINPKVKDGSRYMKDQSVIGRIENKISLGGVLPIGLYHYLLDKENKYGRLKEIIQSEPEALRKKIIPKVSKKISSLGIIWKKEEKEELLEVLGYKNIRKRYTNWLVGRLGIKACPYCGSQYLLGFESGAENKELYQLDHFFPKSEYPYLSISLFNLIPSCSSCNLLKGDRPTTLATYPNPYIDDLNQMFRFKTNPKDVIFRIITQKKEIKIDLEHSAKLSKREKRQLDNHIKRFRLNLVYQNHSDVAEELYWKKYIYNDSRKKELTKLFKDSLGLTKNDIERFITGNYVAEEDLLRRPLGKLVKDLAEELKLVN